MPLRSTRLIRSAAALSVASVTVLSAALVAPAGAAPDPADRKRQVDQAAEALEAQLHEHTEQVAQAAVALRRAQAALPDARARLADARGAVAQAVARDAEAATRLKAAEQRHRNAAGELTEVRDRLESTRGLMGEIARENYQRGGMYGELSLIMEADSPRDLTTRVATMRTVLRAQQDVVDDLSTSRADLAAQEAKVDAARAEVSTLRREAAARLDETQLLEQRAEVAASRVSRLVRRSESVLAEAQQALAEDERRYRQLRSESSRLAEILAGRSGGVVGASGNLLMPVNAPVTSPYGMRRHPITGEYKLHDGTDFGASCGTPVRAATSGQVVRTAALTGYGNQVALDHGRVGGVNLATSYNHLSGFAVSPGERVSRGQVVGYVGTTGYSTGCHLHFMVYENGRTVDPMKWL